MKGIRTIARIKDIVAELKLVVKRELIVINFVPTDIDPLLKEELDRLKITPTTTVPLDEEVRRYDLERKSLFDLPDTSKAVIAVNDLMDRLLKPDEIHIEGDKK